MMDRRVILLGSAGLAALSLTPRLAAAQVATVPRVSPSEYLSRTLMGGTLSKETAVRVTSSL
ncbi:MAG: hypothetical protein AAGC69_09425, partial [Paracraurococcus sp.]